MKRIAVIGTSHVGCLKQAWQELEEKFNQYSLTFFAARYSMYRSAGKDFLAISSGALTPVTDELISAYSHTAGQATGDIALADYDAFWLYGFTPRITLDFSDGVSTEFLEKCFEQVARKKSACYVARTIRKAGFDGSIFVSPPPMRTNESQPVSLSCDNAYQRYIQGYSRCLAAFKAKLVVQPESSLTPKFRTLAQYGVGSEKLDVAGEGRGKHPRSDVSHMNKAFGVAMLNSFLESASV